MERILILLLTLAVLSFADVIFISEEIEKGKRVGSHTIYISKDRLRSDDIRDGKLTGSVIFEPTRGKVYVIDHKEKSYTVITKEYIDSVNRYIEEIKRQMEQQLAQLPPEQREAMKEMMERQMGSLPTKEDIEVSLLKRGAKLHGWRCDLYEERRGGMKIRESCVVPVSELGVEKELVQLIKAFDEFMEGVAKEKVGRMLDKGIPVVEIFYEGGREVSRTVLKKIEKKRIPPETFALPSGYRMKPLPTPGG